MSLPMRIQLSRQIETRRRGTARNEELRERRFRVQNEVAVVGQSPVPAGTMVVLAAKAAAVPRAGHQAQTVLFGAAAEEADAPESRYSC